MSDTWIVSIEVEHCSMPFGAHKGKKVWEVPKDYIEWLLKQPDMDPEKCRKWIGLRASLTQVLPNLGRDDVEFETYDPNYGESPADNYWILCTKDGDDNEKGEE